MRIASLTILLAGCKVGPFEIELNPTPPTEASGSLPTGPADPVDAAPDCSAYEYRDAVYDCATVDYCDNTLENLSPRLACCECDPVLCEPGLDCPNPDPSEPGPGPLPLDDGAPIFFSGSLDGPIVAIGSTTDVWMTASSTAGGFLVSVGEGAGVVEVDCTRDLNTYSCPPFDVDHTIGRLDVDLFQIRLLDADGNGSADGALVRVFGELRRTDWTLETYPVSEIASFSLDSTAPSVVLQGQLPGDRVTLTTSEPLDALEPVFVVDGVTHDADSTHEPFGTLVGASSSELPLDWGTVVGLNDGADLAGNPVDATALIAPYPGPASSNFGFENAEGWAPASAVYPDGFLDFPPGEGTGFALFDDGALVGEVEIGQHQQLAFMYATFGEAVPAARLRIVRPDGSSSVVWELSDAAAVPCETAYPGLCIPWDTASVDVSSYAGERVFLRWDQRVGLSYRRWRAGASATAHLRSFRHRWRAAGALTPPGWRDAFRSSGGPSWNGVDRGS